MAFIETVKKRENLRTDQVLKKVVGYKGGTYAHWQIALAYAKYLSPEMHMAANAGRGMANLKT